MQVVSDLAESLELYISSVKDVGELGVLDAFDLTDDTMYKSEVVINHVVDLRFQVGILSDSVCHVVVRCRLDAVG